MILSVDDSNTNLMKGNPQKKYNIPCRTEAWFRKDNKEDYYITLLNADTRILNACVD